jgi:hypothetical protein
MQLEKNTIHKSADTLSIWNKFAVSHNIDEAVKTDIAQEFSSAIRWQGSYDQCLTDKHD